MAEGVGAVTKHHRHSRGEARVHATLEQLHGFEEVVPTFCIIHPLHDGVLDPGEVNRTVGQGRPAEEQKTGH